MDTNDTIIYFSSTKYYGTPAMEMIRSAIKSRAMGSDPARLCQLVLSAVLRPRRSIDRDLSQLQSRCLSS